MITRRNILALAGVAALAGCGGPGRSGSVVGPTGGGTGEDTAQLVSSKLPRATSAASSAEAAAATKAVTAFSADLFAKLSGPKPANLVCSPYSVAIALGMTATGAKGATAAEMLEVLHAQDVAELSAGLNSLEQALQARSTSVPDGSGKPQQVLLSAANSLWGQREVRWQPAFLDLLARDFGTGMRIVDYVRDPEAARAAINAWVSRQTRTKIPQLIPQGAIDVDTRLALVNALYFKAPWLAPFEPALTQDAPFHRLDGSEVTARLMNSTTSVGFVRGPGWQAVDLPYAGGDLAMAVIVPETGRFAEVQRSVTGTWLSRLLNGFQPQPVKVGLPRWTMRTQAELKQPLTALGMPTAFTDDADFTGMTAQERLQVAAVVHEGYIAVDEAGTEAAAATAVIMRVESAMIDPPLAVIADRPFLYVIHDVPTRTPLFVGQVVDPAAA